MRICDLSCNYRVKLVHEYLNVAMAVKVCEGISLALDPDLELAKVNYAIPTPTTPIIIPVFITTAIPHRHRHHHPSHTREHEHAMQPP